MYLPGATSQGSGSSVLSDPSTGRGVGWWEGSGEPEGQRYSEELWVRTLKGSKEWTESEWWHMRRRVGGEKWGRKGMEEDKNRWKIKLGVLYYSSHLQRWAMKALNSTPEATHANAWAGTHRTGNKSLCSLPRLSKHLPIAGSLGMPCESPGTMSEAWESAALLNLCRLLPLRQEFNKRGWGVR